MTDHISNNGEIYHYGVKGMRWGVRRYSKNSGGISGYIRRKQRTNADKKLKEVRSEQKQVDRELRELRGYAKNPSEFGKTKIATAIRNSQIKSLEKSKKIFKDFGTGEHRCIKGA